jgi:alkylation response protein AidB-like acyl-CoA dehydrogenase
MRATFTQDQLDLAKTVGAIAEGEREAARRAHDDGWTPTASDATLLRDFSVLGVPESAGGVGSDLVDLVVAVEALGRHLVPSTFPAHAAAVQLALGAGLDVTAALEGAERWTPAVDRAADGWTLVPYATGADRVVVLDGDTVAVLGADELSLTPRESLDTALPLTDVARAVVEEGGHARLETTHPTAPGLQRATLVAAAQLCGVAQGAVDLAADYARGRQQFGRVIGSFQGVAFQLVDAVTARKAAWDLTVHAAWAVGRGRPDAEAQVHAAKAAAGKAAVFAAERCIQVHGGMGITMEADPHLHLRRALVLDAWLGSGARHRREAGRLRVDARR